MHLSTVRGAGVVARRRDTARVVLNTESSLELAHAAILAGAETLMDRMKMVRMGLEGGRPRETEVGSQPIWFYKGNGLAAIAPGATKVRPLKG